jgi:hypothetical protein
VHLAEPVSEALIRKERGERIETVRRVEWDKKEGRIISVLEERLGSLVLSMKPLSPAPEEAASILCAEIRSAALPLPFRPEARQLQGRIRLLGRTFPEEKWPDLSDENLQANPEEWLAPFLAGIRSREQLAGLELLPPWLRLLTREQRRLLDQRAPMSLTVPSGRRIPLDYATGAVPVLSVKLQEMRPGRYADGSGRARPSPHPPAVACPPSRADHSGPAGILEQRLPPGQKRAEGPLPQTPLARRPLEGRSDPGDNWPEKMKVRSSRARREPVCGT